MNQQKERALKVIAKYARIPDAKGIEDHYRDSVTYLDRIPRAEPEAVQTILGIHGQEGRAAGKFYGQHDYRPIKPGRFFRKALPEALGRFAPSGYIGVAKKRE